MCSDATKLKKVSFIELASYFIELKLILKQR